MLNFLILDVFREDQQGSGFVAREWRDGLGRSCEAKSAENQGAPAATKELRMVKSP